MRKTGIAKGRSPNLRQRYTAAMKNVNVRIAEEITVPVYSLISGELISESCPRSIDDLLFSVSLPVATTIPIPVPSSIIAPEYAIFLA